MPDAPPLPARVAVAGAGTMGAGIAAAFAAAGSRVALCARRRTSLDEAAARLPRILAALGAAEPNGARARIVCTTSAEEACAGADLVVETIAEELEPKRALLALAERAAAPAAVLASNTSSLPIEALAEALERPDRFAGFHWLNPPELVELVEVVPAARTDAAVVDRLVAWASALGKAPVVVARPVAGFAVNRLQYALLREAFALVEEGILTPEDVDRVLTRGLGPRWSAVGPFEAMDLGGLDVYLAVAGNLLPELSTGTEPPAFLRDAVARGALGAKSGAGLRGRYDPERLAAVAARRERVARGIASLRAEGAGPAGP